MLSTAEALLGLSRHLAAYAMGPDRVALESLEFSGKVLEMAIRLRSSVVSPGTRVVAIARDVGIGRRTLVKEILPALETLGWIEYTVQGEALHRVVEQIPPIPILIQSADMLLELALPDPIERAILRILDQTTVLPLTLTGALDSAADLCTDEEAERAVGYLEALNLAKVIRLEDGMRIVYNPNIWGVDKDFAVAALRCEDANVKSQLSGLIEEISEHSGLPQDLVTSAHVQWIDFAVSQGLIQRSLVVTSDGRERAFLFTPHMARNAFSEPSGVDPTGHVRQLIGSMMFAKNFAHYKLHWPGVFLRRLIEEGEAGDASSIGSDYPMLETAGIVRVEPASNFYKLVLLQADVAEEALNFLDNTPSPSIESIQGLRDQRRYVSPDQHRASTLAKQPATKPEETKRLIAAVRETAGNRHFGR
jgi:hypothetical protein